MNASRSRSLNPAPIAIRLLRRVATTTVVAFAICAALGAGSAAAETPDFTQVAGSPFPAGTEAMDVAFSPDGGLLAVPNYTSSNVYAYSVSSAGALMGVSGSPFSAGFPVAAAFSPLGGLLAVDNAFPGTIGMFSVAANGSLTPVGGSPFAASGHPFGIAFSPDGRLLATANLSGSISVFSVAADGTLSEVTGSPFAGGGESESVAFSPSGATLAVANRGSESVSVYSVAANGELEPITGSPFATGAFPTTVAYGPNGRLLAVSDSGADAVSMFSVAPDGSLTPAAGSPFAAGAEPRGLAFGSGNLLAVTNPNVNEISAFSITADGQATQVAGSPYTDGGYPVAAAFSPNGSTLAISNVSSNDVWMLARSAPSAQIESPASGRIYTLGERVPSTFSCSDPAAAAGLSSCTDSNGGSGPAGLLPTSTAGTHSYTVTATGSSGLTATATINYRVSAAPAASAIPAPESPASAIPAPSNKLVILARRHRRSGAIELRVKVPGRGSLAVLGSHAAPMDWACKADRSRPSATARLGWGHTDVTAVAAGTLSVTLAPTRAATRLLARHRRHGWPLNVLIRATYDPASGSPRSSFFLVPILRGNQADRAMCTD
jgi:6-phosphogluconolactonase (cycloisomerase 2 family)